MPYQRKNKKNHRRKEYRLIPRLACLVAMAALLFALFLSITGKEEAKTEAAAKKKLTVSFIDVGQGNAALIQYKGKNLLLDTGEESQYSKLKNFLQKKKVSRIHTMVLTHNDSDHMGGADLVLEDFTVDKVVQSAYAEKKDTYSVKELEDAITKQQVEVVSVQAGDTIPIADGVKAEVLSPAKDYGDSNANSVVFKLTHGKKSFLFTGDIDAKVEKEILQQYDISVDVLQVAHHGSDYSSAILFLKKASADYAVISVGEGNSYGHPAKTVVKRLKNFSKKIYRTDEHGSITFVSDGKKLKVSTTGATKENKDETKATSAPKTTPASDQTSAPAGDLIIGNKNSLVYHTPSCGNLPYEQNRVYFSSMEEAEAAGYRPHVTCCK